MSKIITMADIEANGLEWLAKHNESKRIRSAAVEAALDAAMAKKTFSERMADFKKWIL